MDVLASIPSPSQSEIHLGPLPLRGYALCVILGVFLAIWLSGRRWAARGGQAETVADIAVWAVPFGLVGARLYHVITDYELYFGEGRDWVDSFKIWDGGIGIWGAVAGGALGTWIACRRRGIALPPLADAIAPGLAFAQAVGRWGNWFNQELFGRATDVPWALEIDKGAYHGTYHPTFLYESLWCVGVGFLVLWADRRFRLGHGRAFAVYVIAYTAGRFWTEYLRIDEAHTFFGLRLNDWTSLVVCAAAVVYLVLSARLRPGREEIVEPRAADAAGAAPEATAGTGDAEGTAGTEDAAGTGSVAADADAEGEAGAGAAAKPAGEPAQDAPAQDAKGAQDGAREAAQAAAKEPAEKAAEEAGERQEAGEAPTAKAADGPRS